MMRTPWPAGRFVRVLAAPLVLAGVLTGLGPAAVSAAACQNWTGVPPPSSSTTFTRLSSVAVLSACDAWAVGEDKSGGVNQTLTEHWDGSSWTVVPSPSPGTDNNNLVSVHAFSRTDIWAVGSFRNSSGGDQTLILRWKGAQWTQVTSLNPGSNLNDLNGVRTVSANNAWAVGVFNDLSDRTGDQTLILRWNGTAWKKVPSPNPGGPVNNNDLNGVTATSARNAWAVGSLGSGTVARTFILRWNGTTWARSKSPSPGTSSGLAGVGATSARNAWAVGSSSNGTANQTLVLHWNGKKWARVRSPNPDIANVLAGVDASSASNIWAVGDFFNNTADQALAVHCC